MRHKGKNRMKKIIMFIGGIETQEYFTKQLAKSFKKMGYDVFLFQLLEEEKAYPALCKFIEPGNTVMITFNFHGLNHEESFYQKDGIFWDKYQIPCYNIVLDHPFYYHKYVTEVPSLYTQISIDRGHERYMRRFFPKIKRGSFLPLAGTEIVNKPWKKRSKEIVFTGNYTPPQKFEQYITRVNQEYTDFYYGIIHDLIENPSMPMDVAFEKHLVREMGDMSDDDLKLCMENMIFIDLYVRFYFRGLAIRTLAESGFHVHVYGSGWELLECRKHDNIIKHGPQNSLGCLDAIADSRISLNVMPWFKEGAHDRVFNSMLNKAVCLSDESIWMKENLKDDEIVFFQLDGMKKLPDTLDALLSNPNRMQEIAENGYRKAKALHTWERRAQALTQDILVQ
jgi:glycosyltransferase involved in cell wall biosynthesis